MDAENLAGSLKVAILIQNMEKEASQKILNSLNDTEKDLITEQLSQMGTISPELVEKVAEEFAELEKIKRAQKAGNNPMLENNQKAQENQEVDEKNTGATSKPSGLNAIQSIEPGQLVKMIKDEHPQTIAIILAHLEPGSASIVLSKLSDELKVEVALRIANLENVISGTVEEIDKVFEDILDNEQNSVTHKTGGVDHMAEILNQVNEMAGSLILDEIEKSDPELAAHIKQKMFVFEDLIKVDDRGFQKALRKFDTRELSIALKGASEELKQKMFRNMSSRASETLQEEIEMLGPVRMKEVEDSQQKISKIVQEMEIKGEIIISGRRGEDVIV